MRWIQMETMKEVPLFVRLHVQRERIRANRFYKKGVEHILSEYESINGVRSHYCYLIIPNSKFIWFT